MIELYSHQAPKLILIPLSYANLSLKHMQSEESDLNPEKRIIGLDAGSVRTGISVADPSNTLASPLKIIHTNPLEGFAARLQEALGRIRIDKAIIGLPLDLRGQEGSSAGLAREIGSLLEKELNCVVIYMDERFSTMLADDGFKRSGNRKSKRKAEIDSRAAAIILQDWLDYRQNASG